MQFTRGTKIKRLGNKTKKVKSLHFFLSLNLRLHIRYKLNVNHNQNHIHAFLYCFRFLFSQTNGDGGYRELREQSQRYAAVAKPETAAKV